MVTPIIQVVNPLTFTDINDSPDNPRLGLGYHQLYDPGKKVGLIAKLPDVTRVGDTVTLYWNEKMVYTDNLDQPTIDKGWLSFSVAPSDIPSMSGEVYYTLLDNVSGDLQTSPKRIIAVNRLVPGGLDPEIETAINEAMAPCTVSPNPVMNPAATVTVTVEKWDHQEVGDELTVMWNNLRVSHPKLTDSGLGPQSVIIPPEVLEAGGSSDKLLVNYEIRDIVDNYSLVSPGTYVRVEIDKDALLEPRVKEADLTTLVLDLAALGNGDAHVLIPRYIGNLKPYTVTLNWVGKTPTTEIPLTLPPERVTDPIFGDAIFVIPNAHLKLIAGGSAVVRYSLVPDGEPEKKSRTTTITLTGLPVPLAAPVVIEANGSVIDLDQIIGASATVNIAAYGGQTAGDKVVLNWKGTTKGGTPVNYTADYDVKAGDTVDILFNIPRAYIDPLESGTLKLSYQVVFNATGTTQNSAIAEYTVNAREVLPAPEVAGVTHGGVLNPASITDGVLVTIKYESMLDTDIIHLDWFGVPTTVLVQGDASKTVQVNIPNSVVAASLSKPVEVRYRVTHAGGAVAASDSLHFTVGQLAETALPAPAIPEAQSGVLDMSTFTDNASVTITTWPLIAAGQTVWLTVAGPNGVPTVKLLDAHPITATQAFNGIKETLLRSELEKFNAGDDLTVKGSVGFDKGTTEAIAIQLPTARYSLRKQTAISITNIKDSTGEIDNNGITIDTTITVTGKASANKAVQILDNDLPIGNGQTDSDGIWSKTLTELAPKEYAITAKGMYDDNPISNRRSFSIKVSKDETNFDTMDWNGWAPGPVCTPLDWSIRPHNNKFKAYNSTHDGSGVGIVLFKTITNLHIGERYEFSIVAERVINAGPTVPQLQLIMGSARSEPVLITPELTVIKVSAVVSQPYMEFSINSLATSPIGNDYYIHNLTVKLIQSTQQAQDNTENK